MAYGHYGPLTIWALWAATANLEHYGPMALWLMALRPYGLIDLWAYGFMALWSYDPMGIWPAKWVHEVLVKSAPHFTRTGEPQNHHKNYNLCPLNCLFFVWAYDPIYGPMAIFCIVE